MSNFKEEPYNLQCYCNTSDEESLECSLQCRICKKLFHLECLVNGKPSPLEGDSFFEFICCYCSDTGIEQTSRIKFQWVDAVILTLYNLQLQGGGKCGFFRWRENICNFIDRNWTTIFGFSKKKTTTWHGTVAGTLSAGVEYFLSGFNTFKETGWWTLVKNRPPVRRDPDAVNVNSNRGSRKKAQTPKVVPRPAAEDDQTSTNKKNIRSSDTRAVNTGFVHPSTSTTTSAFGIADDPLPMSLFQDDTNLSDMEPEDLEINPGSVSPVSVSSQNLDNLLPHMYDIKCSPKEDSSSNSSDSEEEDETHTVGNKRPVDDTLERPPSSSEDPCDEASSSRGSDEAPPPSEYCIVPIGIYEEKQLANRLKQLDDAVQRNEIAKRLKRKLFLRQWKRERGLPIFDLEEYLGNGKKVCNRNGNSANNYVAREPVDRILDRYRVRSSRNLEPMWRHTTFVTRLVGTGDNLSPIVSPYTARVLKPYIWQDFESKPSKLRLLEDIVAYSLKKQATDWTAAPSAPIDYCYVQPQHIPSINALCKQFFWDGIDMSESLQYPDFSCVALYRKVVIGFAFMVPDVKYNEAYISFIFTHPEWRNAGIASFMLYHLIQSCMGKDVTLHVSATSPAVLLYQKFGFKVEEFIVDFYEKYFSEENRECRHAMFLRLSR